ncbi:MAG: sugar phosphate isomerase/epimerase [Armatimonadota bacterium]
MFGYQAVYDDDFFDALDYAAKNGFDFVSFDLNVPRFYIDGLPDARLDEIRGYAVSKNVKPAFHAPGDNISLYTDYPAIRSGILEHFSSIITSAQHLQARHTTIHPGAYPSLKKFDAKNDDFVAAHRDYFSRMLYENVMHLADRAKDVLLCLENFNFTDITMETVDKLLANTDRLFLTWDIAKTYDRSLQKDEMVESFMLKHCDRIREIHIHDIIKDFRSHQIVGEGGIDFSQYADLLHRPDIAITIEVRPREAAKVSRDSIISMLC